MCVLQTDNSEKYKESSNTDKIEVSVIIVNWNSGNYLKKAVDSLYKNTKNLNFELIVIDNNSNICDESYNYIIKELSQYNNANIILNEKNLGFAKGNNIGIEIAKGKNILLLNPDTELKANTLKILFDYIEKNPNVGIVGPKVLNSDGNFQNSCLRGKPFPLDVFWDLSGVSKIFDKNEFLNKFSLHHLNKNEIHKISGLSGCCLMISRQLLNSIGKLDERFFLYFEETDFCWRAVLHGWDVVYNPNAVIVHQKGVTTRKKIFLANYYFIESMIKFAIKYHFKRYNTAQQLLLLIFICLNLPVRNIKSILNRAFKIYEKIIVFN